MKCPGGTVDLTIDCDGCGRCVKVGEIVTPQGVSAGVHVRQTSYNSPHMTVHGAHVYCGECREREARQLNLRNG